MEEKYTKLSTVSFFYLGIEFYLLGRIAFHKQLINAAAVLFHHAVERLLLAEVAVGKTKKELKQRYKNHKLLLYWTDFKEVKDITGKNNLDGVIKRFNDAVDLRFVSLETTSIVFMPTRESISKMTSYESMGKKEKYGHVVVLEDIDLFVKEMVDHLNINPQLVHHLMAMSNRMPDYLEGNRHLIFNPNDGAPKEVKIFKDSQKP